MHVKSNSQEGVKEYLLASQEKKRVIGLFMSTSRGEL